MPLKSPSRGGELARVRIVCALAGFGIVAYSAFVGVEMATRLVRVVNLGLPAGWDEAPTVQHLLWTFENVVRPSLSLLLIVVIWLILARRQWRPLAWLSSGPLPVWQRFLASLAIGGLIWWPLYALSMVADITRGFMARPTMETLVEGYLPNWPNYVAPVLWLGAYGLAAWVSFRLLRDIARRPEGLPDWAGSASVRFGLWLALGYVLGEGTAFFADILAKLYLVGRRVVSGLLAGDASLASRLELLLTVLPLLALPVAVDAYSQIDWSRVRARLGGSPSRLAVLLSLVTLGAVVVWPLQMPGVLGGWAQLLGWAETQVVAIGASVILVLIWLVYFYYFGGLGLPGRTAARQED